MKNTILFLAFLLTALSCGKDTPAKKIETNFEAAFTKVKEISLDSNTVFDIRYIDVNDDNDLLITNKPRTEVFLYDSLGRLKARLSEKLDKEFPGGNWAPTQAYFFKNGEILVANRVPWGIRFDREGNFKNFMPEEYQGSPYLSFDSQNHIYSFTNDYRGFYISKYNSDGTEIFQSLIYISIHFQES